MAVYRPSQVIQFSEAEDIEIPWTSTNVPADRLPPVDFKIRTTKDLKHIANPATGDLRDGTWALKYTGFNIPEGTVATGIELNIVAQRNGRIVDDVIQLIYQDSIIGENNFVYITDEEGHLPIKNESTYGGPGNFWGAEVTSEMLSDPSFGVILKFQSHPYYPHSSGMTIESVVLTIYE